MKKICLSAVVMAIAFSACSPAPTSTAPADLSAITNTVRTNIAKRVIDPRSDQEKQADRWLATLKLDDAEKEKRLQQVIATHLTEVRNFHNGRVYEMNQTNGGKPIMLEQQLAADSALPKSVHEDLMTGLRKDLNEEQVEAILDQYTSRRMGINLEMYQAAVPDLTPEEKTALVALLKEAREQAVDYKSKEEIVAIFERYKVKCQDYLISKGRKLETEKAAGTNAPAAPK